MDTSRRTSLVATAVVAATGALWGGYWLPVRWLAEKGLPGAWGTLAITLAAALALLPFAISAARAHDRTARAALLFAALGGGAFAIYSIGFLYGRVAIVILLWFLSPIWSTLIGRWVMGWPTPPLRIVAIAVGLAGLLVMLGAGGEAPVPRSAGEWMALAGGLLWSVATTGLKVTPPAAPALSVFAFALGAAFATALLLPVFGAFPAGSPAPWSPGVIGVALATGVLWWGLSMVGLLWATVRLEPARVAILLMTEIPVGAASAALLAGERLTRIEMLGATLILSAAVLEVWPSRATRH